MESRTFRELQARYTTRSRGIVAVATIVVLLIVDLIILALVIGGARDHDLTVRRMQTVEAFYAGEAGINMAIREKMEGANEDGDQYIGTISSELVEDPNNDPTLGNARFFVTIDTPGGDTFTCEGRSGDARRTMQVVIQ